MRGMQAGNPPRLHFLKWFETVAVRRNDGGARNNGPAGRYSWSAFAEAAPINN